MPSYVSKGGVWYPTKEKVALKNYSKQTIKNPSTDEKLKGEEIKPGEDYIYAGPDRAALYELWQAKVENFGSDFRKDPEFLQACRNMGYSTYKQYLKDIGFDEEKMEADFKDNADKVTLHELPQKVDAIDILAGGKDTSGGGNDVRGEWKSPPGFEKASS
jgi:hypothetical protein